MREVLHNTLIRVMFRLNVALHINRNVTLKIPSGTKKPFHAAVLVGDVAIECLPVPGDVVFKAVTHDRGIREHGIFHEDGNSIDPIAEIQKGGVDDVIICIEPGVKLLGTWALEHSTRGEVAFFDEAIEGKLRFSGGVGHSRVLVREPARMINAIATDAQAQLF